MWVYMYIYSSIIMQPMLHQRSITYSSFLPAYYQCLSCCCSCLLYVAICTSTIEALTIILKCGSVLRNNINCPISLYISVANEYLYSWVLMSIFMSTEYYSLLKVLTCFVLKTRMYSLYKYSIGTHKILTFWVPFEYMQACGLSIEGP